MLSVLQVELPKLGLELNVARTMLWGPGVPGEASPLRRAARLELENSMQVLGVPICIHIGDAPLSQPLTGVQAKQTMLLGKVGELSDKQSAHALMRMCLGPSRIQNALRTLPLAETAEFADAVSKVQCEAFTKLLGGNLSDSGWQQASLPLSEGGCGLSCAAFLAPVARLAGIIHFMAQAEGMLECDRTDEVRWAEGPGAVPDRILSPFSHVLKGPSQFFSRPFGVI